MSNEKNFDDVGQLVDRLHLDGLKYREFGEHRPAKLKLAGGTVPPAAPVAATAPQPTAPTPAAPAAAPAVQAPAAAANRVTVVRPAETVRAPAPIEASARTVASPLNFTFERLRRQVIGSRVHAPVLQLQLQPRKAASSERTESLMQKPVSELFSQIAQSAPSAKSTEPAALDPLRLKR